MGSPVWIADQRISAVAGASIDRSTVDMDKGEMSFAMFDFNAAIDELANGESDPNKIVDHLAELLGDAFPPYLRTFIRQSIARGRCGLKLFPSGHVFPGMTDEEKERIERRQGFLTIRDQDRVGNVIHFLRVFKNDQGRARLFYKFDGSVSFIKNLA
jgi:hypothetical protein